MKNELAKKEIVKFRDVTGCRGRSPRIASREVYRMLVRFPLRHGSRDFGPAFV